MGQKIKVLKEGLPAIAPPQDATGGGSIPAPGSVTGFASWWSKLSALHKSYFSDETLARQGFEAGWRAGMTHAAWIANTAKVREDSHNTKASVQVCIKLEIERSLNTELTGGNPSSPVSG